jgi:anti-sigma regulatory factor (Ser/Thr protein kinase)
MNVGQKADFSNMPESQASSFSAKDQSIVLRNSKGELGRLASFVQQFCDDTSLDKETRFALDLALTEWITNVFNYGALAPGAEIKIQMLVSGSELRCTIEDSGKAFNPLDRAEVDTSVSLDDKPIGGLGIHMIRKLMDRVVYERVSPINRLILIKKLPD